MVFTCYLCNEESVYTKYYCPTCEKTKRIVNVYGKEKVLEILEKVCLRKSEKLQNYKINDIYDYNQKKELIKLLWDVAFADGRIDKYEDYTIRKIADLIYVRHEDFMKAKHR